MKQILHIISSPRGELSVSGKLGNAIVEQIKSGYPGIAVKERDLVANPFPHLQATQINAFYTPPEFRTAAQVAAIKDSDEAIAELQDADIIVIDSPMYNLSVTSTLKAYFDHTVRGGKTFRSTEHGPEGLLKNKKVYIAFASGYIFSEGAWKAMDFATTYLEAILGFIGMTDVTIFRAEGLALPVVQDTALQTVLKTIAGFEF